jgi:hypothetical protein
MSLPRLAIPLAIIAALLAWPQVAAAGSFTVHTCQTPTGRLTGDGGWTSDGSTPVPGYDPGLIRRCAVSTGGTSLNLGTTTLPARAGSWRRWDFTAPAGTFIESYVLERSFALGWPVVSGVANRPYLLQIWHDHDPGAGVLDFKVPSQAGATVVQPTWAQIGEGGVSWKSLHVDLSCWVVAGTLDCGPYPAHVTISRAQIGLRDEEAPDGFATGGTLAGSEPVRGVGSLSLHASDEGGGVYRVALAVDGDEVLRRIVGGAGGACADVEPGNGDPHEFDTPQPCPLATDDVVEFDTATLRDGAHAVRVTVEDAGGDETVVFDGAIQTHNAPVSSAGPELSGQARVGSALSGGLGQWDGAPTGYERRWLRCDADGSDCDPIVGASDAGYVLREADAYHRVRVEVTAENGSGAAVARSAPSALVADADGRTAPPTDERGDTGAPGTGGGSGTPGTGGDQGLVNPLAPLPGHVANGSEPSARARIAVAFQRADGGTARRLHVRHGRRVAIVGRLTDASGAGIAGARLGVAWRVAGRAWAARPEVRTGADGRFVYLLPAGPSRDVRFAYFPYSDSRAAELSNVVHVDVLAPLAIHADRTRVAGKRVVTLSGRVGGGSIPRAGLLVTLQGFQRGWGWRTFRTVRTDRRGGWRTRYRFHLTAGRFGFRALVPRQGAFPFATSRSRAVYVVVS